MKSMQKKIIEDIVKNIYEAYSFTKLKSKYDEVRCIWERDTMLCVLVTRSAHPYSGWNIIGCRDDSSVTLSELARMSIDELVSFFTFEFLEAETRYTNI